MIVYEVPVTAQAQYFTINLNGVSYDVKLAWNLSMQCWVIDLTYSTTQLPAILGVPLLTGQDLLAQYAYMLFGGQLVVQTDHDSDAMPTLDNLGTLSHLYFVVTP